MDGDSVETRKLIAKCIWKTDELGHPLFDRLKIDSEVASDDDKEEFLAILRDGKAEKDRKSRYAKTYAYFSNKISEFVSTMPMYTALFPVRILNNVILLPIEAESQDTALRIFSTLNDRGLPLSDAESSRVSSTSITPKQIARTSSSVVGRRSRKARMRFFILCGGRQPMSCSLATCTTAVP